MAYYSLPPYELGFAERLREATTLTLLSFLIIFPRPPIL